MISTDNRERFRTLHREFGLDNVFADEHSVTSLAKDIGFPKREINFLKLICSPDYRALKRRILDEDVDVGSVVERIVDEVGYDRAFAEGVMEDIRNALSGGAVIVTDYEWDDGLYCGPLLNSVPHGRGIIRWSDGGYYEGDFVDGKRTGEGTYYWTSGNRYEGDFVDDRRTGKGTYYWADGDRYEGDFANGVAAGKGSYYWGPDSEWVGSRYEGDFDIVMHGKGILYWADGDRFEGVFVEGRRTGKGTYYWADGDRYEGDFEDGEMIEGVQYWLNGDSYDSCQRVYRWADGTRFIKGLGRFEGFLDKGDITYTGDYVVIGGIPMFRGHSVDDESVTIEEELHFQELREDCWQGIVHVKGCSVLRSG